MVPGASASFAKYTTKVQLEPKILKFWSLRGTFIESANYASHYLECDCDLTL